MRIVYFTHSLRSCWNHGNAHFLRGVLRQLIRLGHDVRAYEPAGAWSLQNLLHDDGDGLAAFDTVYPDLRPIPYQSGIDLDAMLDGADLVLVHEWNDPALVAAVGRRRARGGRFTLLFHDTHHRAVSDPQAIRTFDLSGYDGVLAFGEALAEVYRRWGWGRRVFVWHEAADTTVFQPPLDDERRKDLVWVGNWGDDERTAELETFLFQPAQSAGIPLDVYGVRYPQGALATLVRYGGRYHGWLPNARAPEVFARHLLTVHVPRRFYVEHLPGIPTIRVFEALACGIPLVCAPWSDSEHLFRPGQDFLYAHNAGQMRDRLRALMHDRTLRQDLARSGLATIRARHTCDHRAAELLSIHQHLAEPVLEAAE